MTINRLVALAGLVIALGSSATGATAAPTAGLALHSCGVVTAAGKRWAVLAAGVSCPGSKSLVGKLARRKPGPIPTASHRRYPSLPLGMVCTWNLKGPRTVINCLAPNGTKVVEAVGR